MSIVFALETTVPQRIRTQYLPLLNVNGMLRQLPALLRGAEKSQGALGFGSRLESSILMHAGVTQLVGVAE
jgi:hypothetical protein